MSEEPMSERHAFDYELGSHFHFANRILPEDQDVERVPQGTSVMDALGLMRRFDYSQLPVTEGLTVVGLFSHRSLAEGLGRQASNARPRSVADLTVLEFADRPRFIAGNDDLEAVVEALRKRDAVLVGNPSNLVGIITPWDVADYVSRVSRPFILVEEIELTVREFIRACIPAGEVADCARACLFEKYEKRREDPPSTLEDMDFGDHVQIIVSREFWPKFGSLLGNSRDRAIAWLVPARDFRNDLFHFKWTDVTVEGGKYATAVKELASVRDWLLTMWARTQSSTRGLAT